MRRRMENFVSYMKGQKNCRCRSRYLYDEQACDRDIAHAQMVFVRKARAELGVLWSLKRVCLSSPGFFHLC